jgi:hypothetical protein
MSLEDAGIAHINHMAKETILSNFYSSFVWSKRPHLLEVLSCWPLPFTCYG